MPALSLLLCTCLLAAFTTSLTCYWPDGTASDYTPCPGVDENNAGPCCSETDTKDPCLQGEGAVGNCLSLYGFIYRGACTDPNWEASTCAQACWTDESGAGSNSFVPLAICGGSGICCGFPEVAGSCCANGNPASGNPFQDPSVFASGSDGWFSGILTSTCPVRSASPSSSRGPADTTTVTLPATTFVTTIVPGAFPTASGKSADPVEVKSNEIALGVGLGIGVPCALGSVATLWLFIRRRLIAQ